MKRLQYLLLLICALLSVGCSTTPPERQDFLIAAQRNAASHNARFGALQVNELRSQPPYRDLAMIYKESAQRFVADPYHGYLAPVSSQITQQTRAWFAQSGLFSRVYPTGSSQIAPWQLEGELIAMYVDVSTPAAPKVVIQSQFLVSHQTKTATFMLNAEQPLSDPSPNVAAQGFSHALESLLQQLEQHLIASNLD